MCVFQTLAGKVFLHHVLVEPRHNNSYECTAKQLFPEILRGNEVVPHEHTAITVAPYRPHRFGNTHAQLLNHIIYNKQKCRKHAQSLERIGPHQRLYASTPRVKPYQCHHHHHRNGKRNAHGIEHKALQDDADNIETHGGTRHLRHEKESRPRLVRPLPQPLL